MRMEEAQNEKNKMKSFFDSGTARKVFPVFHFLCLRSACPRANTGGEEKTYEKLDILAATYIYVYRSENFSLAQKGKLERLLISISSSALLELAEK
jgi:hypothetical protein